MRRLVTAIAVVTLLVACGSAAPAPTAPAQPPTAAGGIPTSTQRPLSAKGVIQELQSAGLPVGEVTAWTADTDPNKLLGRPGQYIDKATFRDTRLQPLPEPDVQAGGDIEIFRTAGELQVRRDYIEAVTRSSPLLAQYVFSSGLVLLRVSGELTPDQAAAYDRALADAIRGSAP